MDSIVFYRATADRRSALAFFVWWKERKISRPSLFFEPSSDERNFVSSTI